MFNKDQIVIAIFKSKSEVHENKISRWISNFKFVESGTLDRSPPSHNHLNQKTKQLLVYLHIYS